MYKWGDDPQHFYPVVAAWLIYSPIFDGWMMYEYALHPETGLYWRKRQVPTDDGHVRVEIYNDSETALAATEALNLKLIQAIPALGFESSFSRSLELKAGKAIQAKSRLANEEKLMRSEAIRRAENLPRIRADELVLPVDAEVFRADLVKQLTVMPYLNLVVVGSRGSRRILYRRNKLEWSAPYSAGVRNSELATRAEIANGFGHAEAAHWGKTKAVIRELLLPRANKLLQLASVQRLLAEAKARGQRVLVCNGIIFWYEESGDIGWEIKQTSSTADSDGETLWREGTILSKNHGRLIILPYIKESGEHVQGHTRNGPRDGPAKPRHPDHYVNVPFEVLADDLMIGLFGELPYE